MIHLTATTKLLAVGVALSLGWIVLEACDCDETQTKEDQFPGFWVTCIGNQPTLMTYNGNSPIEVSTTSAGNFNPSDWDCMHDPSSPSYRGSQASAPFEISGPSGPLPGLRPHATGTGSAYVPRSYLNLPFTPDVPPPGSPPVCDSTYPDVLRTDQLEGLVTRISTCPFAVKTTIPVPAAPLEIQVTPDGSTALVTSFNSAVSFINLSTNQVTYTLNTDPSINPHGLAISPDGTTAYITNFNTGTPSVLVINIPTMSIVASGDVSTVYPQSAILTPDGSQLWITSALESETDVMDTQTNTEIIRLNVPASTDVAFNSTGTTAYITSSATNPGLVYAVDTTTFQTVTTYTVGNLPTDITMSYGDQFLVVNNSQDNSISVIDLVKNKVSTTQVGGSPVGIAFVH